MAGVNVLKEALLRLSDQTPAGSFLRRRGLRPQGGGLPAPQPSTTSASSLRLSNGADSEVVSFTFDDEAEGIRSYLAQGEVIEGNLRLKGGIRIAGTVTGWVRCERGAILIEKTGVVVQGVEGRETILIDGQVGTERANPENPAAPPVVQTPGLLVVMGSGRVLGGYHYGQIATYDEAILQGPGKTWRRWAELLRFARPLSRRASQVVNAESSQSRR